jgi:transcriptional regulator with XRE-family HTH domain
MSTLGELITQAMAAKGLDRKALGAAVGVSHATLSRWITGRSMPGRYQSRLAAVLGLSPQDLAAAMGRPAAAATARLDEPGRWRRYAERYPAFGEHARDAHAGGVSDATLDRAADSLGEHKGSGPTPDESRQAIVDAIRRVDGWRRVQLREATEEDFDA